MADNKSYVTNELLDELNDILEEKTMFDDFSGELAKTAPVGNTYKAV